MEEEKSDAVTAQAGFRVSIVAMLPPHSPSGVGRMASVPVRIVFGG